MCMSKKHIEYLERTNESDYQQGRISYETYIRFIDIVERCHECDLCGNGKYGDILSECRLHFVRVFASMKRDMEKIAAEKRVSTAVAVAGDTGASVESTLAAIVAEDTGVSADVDVPALADPPATEAPATPEAATGTDKPHA